jgi:hypothetical protein
MNAEVIESGIEWTPKLLGSGRTVGRRSQRLILVGARFKRPWLEQVVIETLEIRLEGDLAQALKDLLSVARESTGISGMALPIARLRASLLARVPGVIGLDRDLGIGRREQSNHAALTVNRWSENGETPLAEVVAECLRRWYHDALSGWAECQANAGIAERVLTASIPSNIRIVPADRRLYTTTGGRMRPDFGLVVRHVAESLVGEELFPGLGACELVTDALARDPLRSNFIELMTAPVQVGGRDETFSMAARLSAVSMPYSQDLLLRISASKRTWASKEPGPKRNAPFAVRGYVMGPDRPVFTVSLARTAEQGWQFGDDYAEWLQLSGAALPSSLSEAVARRVPGVGGWWAGLPLLTTLFDTVPQRTVFEGDELELHAEVVKRLPAMLHPDIPFRALSLPRRRSSGSVAMLRLSDLGLAGQVLEETESESVEDGLDEDVGSDDTDEKRRTTLDRHREQNIRALKEIHGEMRPVLWSFCSSEQERAVIARTVEQLFGDAVQLHAELLPPDTHGLRQNLPGATSKQRERFDLRVKAWKAAAEVVRAGGGPRHALICASDRDNGRAEDPVNYYAGLHAMCQIADANVHHVLPIGAGDPTKAMQHFVHRLQSALLDVFFAHSGVIFGTHEFLRSLFDDKAPKYIYGIQAARSQARAYSGEIGVSFLLFTRLNVQQGRTDVRFVYRSRHSTNRTEWMPLNEGLRWLGSQRALESDEVWLRDTGAREVRDFLGQLNTDDPRAFVLVDWSTMASLWRGLSDEDLTRDGIARIDGKDISAACPEMTLIRLRRGENTIALRSQNTSMFQRTGQRQQLAGLEIAGESYTETYATTTKAIVAIEHASDERLGRASRHYIQSMGYRSTVQIVRGQSCYRPRQRMRRSKASQHTFQLGVLEPSQQDAALPAPLEVTVMACPTEISPDHVAIAVLGLRLGYVHYNDWTALPAPLFFKRKVDDHIVRYRSPSSAAAEEDLDADVATLTLSAGAEPEAADVFEPLTDTSASTEIPQNSYLLRAAHEVVPFEPSFISTLVDTREETVDGSVGEASALDPLERVSDTELKEIAEGTEPPDERLVSVVQRLRSEDFALVGNAADFKRRRLYDSMICGRIRVQVPTPSFVTAADTFGDRPPSDREVLRRFWRDQREIGWVRHGETMPPLGKLGQWIFRRLQVPQAGYSVHSSRLFPRRPLFQPIHVGWKCYLNERIANATPEDDEAGRLTEEDLRLDLLTQWAVAREDDLLLAWLIVGCAHFPFADSVLFKVLPYLRAPIGNATREALYYFIDCARASRAVAGGMVRPSGGAFVLPARSRAINVPGGSTPTNPPREQTAEPEAIVTNEPFASNINLSDFRGEGTVLNDSSVGEIPASAEVLTRGILEAVQQLLPGAPEFEFSLKQVHTQLAGLERLHLLSMHAQEVARAAAEARAAEQRAAEERAAEERAAEQRAAEERAAEERAAEERAAEQRAAEERARAARVAQWQQIRAQATAMLEAMRVALPDMQTFRAEPVTAPPELIEEAPALLQALQLQIDCAKQAQQEYETVDARATPPATLTPREAGRHRNQWQDALRSAHETLETALTSLTTTLRSSGLFLVTDSSEELHSIVNAVQEIAEVPSDGSSVLSEPVEWREPSRGHEPATDNVGNQDKSIAIGDRPYEPDANVDVECGSDEDESCDDVDAQATLDPMGLRARSQVILDLLRPRAYAAAAVYEQALLQLDLSTGGIGDHALVTATAIESIRRLRSDSSTERPENVALRTRLLDSGGVQLPGCTPLAGNLGMLAAGICEMLFPSADPGARWTYINYLQHRFGEQPSLQAFIKRIESLEGIYLAQEMLTEASIGARQSAINQVARMRERAKNWSSDETLYRKWTASDYRQLHDALFRNEELPIARCLGMIARGEDDKLRQAFHDASKRMSRPLGVIEDLAKRMGRRRPFDGVARGHIAGNIERTRQFIEDYLEAVRRASGLQTPVAGNVRGTLHGLYQDLTAATEAIAKLQFEDCIDRMYREIAHTVMIELQRMFDCGEPAHALSDSDQMLLLRLPLGVDGQPSLQSQQDAGVVEPLTAIEEIESLARLLNDSGELFRDDLWIKKQLEHACDDHLANHRLLPARLIDQRLGRSAARNAEQLRSLTSLQASLHHERQRVTHAMALGALSQAEASRMLRLIEDMLQIKTFGDPVSAPAGIPDFPHALDALRRSVIQPLDSQLAKSKAAFSQELDLYREQFADQPSLAHEIDRIRALANERSASSMRAARDMFSLLKDGSLPKKVTAGSRTPADDYRKFVFELREALRGHRPLIESLSRRLQEAPQESDPAWLAPLDAASRCEIVAFLEAWEKACAAKTSQDCEKPLAEFFRGLRLEPTLNMLTDLSNAHRMEFFLENAPLSGVDRSTGGLFIPPMLGSERPYLQGIVVRQTAPESAVSQAIDERCQAAPSFLLSRASWTLERRAALSRNHPILLIDDNLVAYAALHPQQRLQKLMDVALLTFNGNPYDDYGKPVPPEMFFGRQPELRRLRQVKTAAVLYGGRRLGKSSLLDQLQRDAQGSAGEVVVLLTLDRADRSLSDDHTHLAWNAIYRRLLQMQVLEKPKTEPTTAIAIRSWIEDEIVAGRCRAKGIYLLIDEADEVMGRDLRQGGPFVSALLRLCESVRGKCAMRFVVAGLHNLTRMANEENSPLGKFESIALKPFWSAEDIQRGIELIKTPLEALGFYFGEGKEDMPLRIMAVCNFYPAFIQLYCKRLVEHLYVRRDKSAPPAFITQEDLEKVELDREFLADIRSKFKLNLDLDKRYAAIALVLADQYYADGAAKALTPAEVRNLCDLFAGRHFESTGPGAYASLLDEMETLTILEQVGARYGLRTPNIAMMLGDRDSISQQLEALTAEIPVQSRSRGEHRTVMTSASGGREQHTFPMPSAWVRHALSKTGIDPQIAASEADRELLVFVGNELSGLTQLSRLRGDWQLGDTVTCQFGTYSSPNAARSALLRGGRSAAVRATSVRRLHCIGSGGWLVNDIHEYARLAATIGASNASGNLEHGTSSVTRLALIAGPARAYEVAKMMCTPATDIRNWRVVAVPPWSDDALYFRLERLEKPDVCNSEEARQALLRASCGFGAEIERICGGRLRVEDALRAPAAAERTLAPDLDTFYRKIGIPPAIEPKALRDAEDLLRALDGETRNAERTEEFRNETAVSPELFTFLVWMGLLQEAPTGTWQIPQLYKRLLS